MDNYKRIISETVARVGYTGTSELSIELSFIKVINYNCS
jgi:hypothetical protein